MNNTLKILLIILIGIYVISPVDLMPGPIDDIIVILLGFAMNRKSIAANKINPDGTIDVEGKYVE